MNADDRPASRDAHSRDDAVERFAVVVDGGAADGDVDPELARELEIVNRLAAQGSALDPDPETRARHRLMAALSAERAAGDGPSRAS